mmetsp:Transcript_14600/g.31775  ORF Transcript_14600/g.31775 Transcript_14600/m.31775 type:complete len:480 (+) Transcript_14600:27-1466(+)
MDKFFSNLGGGGDKKKNSGNSKKQGKDGANSSWQGGRSGDIDSIKKKNAGGASASRIGGGSGSGGGNKTAGKGNIFANAGAGINDALGKIDLFNKPNKSANSRGGGQSLGGSKPGRVLSVSLDQPGPLGMEVEKQKAAQTTATAIIAAVVPNSQAEKAGLKRGDIICHPDSNGEQEIRYDQFLAMAKSGSRPLRFQVRRIESSILKGGDGRTGNKSTAGRVSADSYARKQAVIAAAEARDAKHKAKQKPISKTGKRMDGLQPQQQTYQHNHTNDSEETRRAVAAVKQAEKNDAINLGYNPYQTNAMTSGQARTATVAVARGDINVENASSNITRGGDADVSSPGRVNKPSDPTAQTEKPTPEFEHAFSSLVTSSNSDHAALLKSLSIMRKLINNAITKGQQGNDETSSKFRRVRLSNPKIKEAIIDIPGALELMMSAGFVLSENDDDGETYLVFPPGEKGASWLGGALAMMESYENGGS